MQLVSKSEKENLKIFNTFGNFKTLLNNFFSKVLVIEILKYIGLKILNPNMNQKKQ